MTISLPKALGLGGAAAAIYVANNYIASSSYGHALPHATQGFAFGAVAGLLMNHAVDIPRNASSLFMMALSGITAVNLGRSIVNGNYTALTGLTEIAGMVLGFGASYRHGAQVAMSYSGRRHR